MFIKETNVSDIINELKQKKISSNYFLDHSLVEYYVEYNYSSKFIDRSFIIEDGKDFLYCPLTIEKKKN